MTAKPVDPASTKNQLFAAALQTVFGNVPLLLPSQVDDDNNDSSSSSPNPDTMMKTMKMKMKDLEVVDLATLHEASLRYNHVEEYSTELENRKERRNTTAEIVEAGRAFAPTMAVFVRSLTGKNTPIQVNPNHTVAYIKCLMQEKGGPNVDTQRLVFRGKNLEDFHTLADENIISGATIHLVMRLRGGGDSPCPMILPPNVLDRGYDYDFTNVNDKKAGKKFSRGGVEYFRPCGWNRIAINVSGKYDRFSGKDTWLGSSNAEGEWAVSYHGTNRHAAGKIIDKGFDISKCVRDMYGGQGVYSSNKVEVAEQFASEFTFEGSKYLVVIQNRIDISKAKIVPAKDNYTRSGDFYISPDSALRPYGLLVKKVGGSSPSSSDEDDN